MNDVRLPWLELSILIPLLGAVRVGRLRDPRAALRGCLGFSIATLACAALAWLDFAWLQGGDANPRLLADYLGRDVLVIDELSAPLLPLVALLHLLVATATLSTKMRRFSFAWALASEAIALATLSCRDPWCVIVLLAVGTVPPWLELRARGKSTRIFTLHMALCVALLVIGAVLVQAEASQVPSWWAVLPLAAAVCVRTGIVPVHCWMSDLFENATFGTALLFVTPITGAYAAVRLVLPIAPEEVLRGIGLAALATAVYAAGMALVQREARRFFCYLFLSHSALVLVGLEIVTPTGLAGALLVWLAICLSLTGFGLTLRAIEARTGRLSLTAFHGLYDHMPMLAVFFLLTGLASVGFPGTMGYLGTELLVEGAVDTYPYVGMAVVLAAALNGIAVVKAFFHVFTGARHASSVSLRIRRRERIAVLTLTILILGGGLLPQPGLSSREHAAREIIRQREQLLRERADASDPSGLRAQN